MTLKIMPLRLSGLLLIKPRLHFDERGFFFESYRTSDYQAAGVNVSFAQDNFAFSKKNVVRGLHYQSYPGQAKLITALQGKIWDVAVDCRPDSPTFGQWESVFLDDETYAQLFIPVGFAHGYCTLSDTARIQYKVSTPYDPSTECSILWNDPQLNIAWPILNPILSPKDQTSPLFYERGNCKTALPGKIDDF